MKKPKSKIEKTPAPLPVFPQTMHRLRVKPGAKAGPVAAAPKEPKRDNIFSKSRDTREDRGVQQMKKSTSPQTFSRSR